jgi:hypothetical protein
MWLFFCYLITIANALIPPIGNIYCTKITVPLIGSQYVESKVISNKRVEILLEGKINQKGQAIIRKYKNKEEFLLNKEFADYLNDKKIEFKLLNYDKKKDEVNFKIDIKPIFFTKKVTLKNIENLK